MSSWRPPPVHRRPRSLQKEATLTPHRMQTPNILQRGVIPPVGRHIWKSFWPRKVSEWFQHAPLSGEKKTDSIASPEFKCAAVQPETIPCAVNLCSGKHPGKYRRPRSYLKSYKQRIWQRCRSFRAEQVVCISRQTDEHKRSRDKKKEGVKESSRGSVCVPLVGQQLDRVSSSEHVIASAQHKAGRLSVLRANRRLYVKDRLWRLIREPWASETKHELTEQLQTNPGL
ncbi:unnamed protein product [Xyrichtys novacula]|uniref:Unnamed protein product n=1 Tax=Xyrichtys novacula TaxID=13765 RepID=A0AAV1GYI8_XYRNO|nr:unnamed protein product [Xyrichtys novacula]